MARRDREEKPGNRRNREGEKAPGKRRSRDSPSPSSLDGERDSPVGRKRRRVAAAPWRRDDDDATLDAEAASFAAWARPSGDERRARRALERRVAAVARGLWPRSTCRCYGSSASGSDWFESDLDLRVEVNEPMTYLSPSRACVELEDALRAAGGATGLEARPHARVPIVCFEDGPTGVSVDVSFADGDDDGDASPLKHFSPAHDQADLMLVLKAWTRGAGLDKPFTGGVGSFRLGVLADSYLRRYHRDPSRYPSGRLAGFPRWCLDSFDLHRDAVVLRHGGRSARVAYGGVDVSRFRRACAAAVAEPTLSGWIGDVDELARRRGDKRARAARLCQTSLRGAAIPPPPSYAAPEPYEPDLFGIE